MNIAMSEMAGIVSARGACALTGRPRATHYRDRRPLHGPAAPRSMPANALSDAEIGELLDLLLSARFVDLAPAQVWAILLDENRYVASISTKGVYYDLYVIIDIFSRYVIDWMIAPTETAELAEAFIARAIASQNIDADTLTIHADRGTSMTSKPVGALLAELRITRSHSRPHLSNDNPYSEAASKTLKYCPAFPARFGSIQDARAFCVEFFDYYNHHHRHSGIALHTAASVHLGTAKDVQAARAATLTAAYTANPRRFCNRRPTPPPMPTVAWINQPTMNNDAQKTS